MRRRGPWGPRPELVPSAATLLSFQTGRTEMRQRTSIRETREREGDGRVLRKGPVGDGERDRHLAVEGRSPRRALSSPATAPSLPARSHWGGAWAPAVQGPSRASVSSSVKWESDSRFPGLCEAARGQGCGGWTRGWPGGVTCLVLKCCPTSCSPLRVWDPPCRAGSSGSS